MSMNHQLHVHQVVPYLICQKVSLWGHMWDKKIKEKIWADELIELKGTCLKWSLVPPDFKECCIRYS